MAFDYSVNIRDGFGEIKFGITPEQVQRIVGLPDEKEVLDPGTQSTEMWYYTLHKLQIVFGDYTNEVAATAKLSKRVVQLTTSHPAATLWNIKIIGLTEDQVLGLFRRQGFDCSIQIDIPRGGSDFKSFQVPGLRVTLDFGGGVLQRILWGSKRVAHKGG